MRKQRFVLVAESIFWRSDIAREYAPVYVLQTDRVSYERDRNQEPSPGALVCECDNAHRFEHMDGCPLVEATP